ncbi:MAG: hypothetical protein JW807_05565 [Spirochaetes bacterium]|nr:hypothetical protein [Spirochaetota bacterium]
MKFLKHAIALSVILFASFVVNCGKTPLLTDIGTSKLIIVLKGTYESNSPMYWDMPEACASRDGDGKCTAYTPQHETLVQDDSVIHCTAPLDINPNGFMLDIAEVKLADAKSNLYKLSDYRQKFAFGLNDVDPFFNGIGTIINSDDVPSNIYPVVGIYVRKMLTDNAKKYVVDTDGWNSSLTWDIFAESELPAFNFNRFQYNSMYDRLRYEATYINRVFPLLVRIKDQVTQGTGMYFNMKNQVTVLEIRMVVKNFLKKYEYLSSSDESFSLVHYYAFSDWLNDVQDNERYIGGNILTVARSYIVGMTGSIPGRNGRSHDAHIIAIPHGEDVRDYTLEVPGDSVDWSVDPPVLPPSRRKRNPCNMPRGVGTYTGTSIIQALEYYLRGQKYKYDWNQKIWNPVTSGDPPATTYRCPASGGASYPDGDCCESFTQYGDEWTSYDKDIGHARVPQLAVFARTADGYPMEPDRNRFSIQNVTPGSYDLYIAQRAPVYGVLYYSYADPAHPTFGASDFIEYSGNPVTVTIGGCHDSFGNTSINFSP